jgi:hypothetical protein
MKAKTAILFPSIFAITFLSSCGGGGGSGGGGVSNTSTYTVSGSVTGLVGVGLSLSLNVGSAVPVDANVAFTFSSPLTAGTPFVVTIAAQPMGPTQSCSVANGSGTVNSANITNVAVTCAAPAYSIGGTVSGLLGSGLTLHLNGGAALGVSDNGNFVFGTTIASGVNYTVTINAQPSVPSQTCNLTGDSGTVTAANVTNVAISCPAPPPIAGNVQTCKLVNSNAQFQLGLGFPRSNARLKNSGTVRITVLFVDFPDVAAVQTPQQVLTQVSPTSEAYFAAVSYGAMNVVYDPHLQWLRMSGQSNSYGFGSLTYQQHKNYLQEAVNLAVRQSTTLLPTRCSCSRRRMHPLSSTDRRSR